MDTAVEVGGRKKSQMRQCRSDELQVGEALYGSVGVVVLNGMTMKRRGEKLCDNCPKGNFWSTEAVTFCMLRPVFKRYANLATAS